MELEIGFVSLDQRCVERVLRDVRATTSLDIELRLTADTLDVFLGGNRRSSATLGPTSSCLWLADDLQDQWIIEQIGMAWPRCVAHGRHPMRPEEREGGDVFWVCPHDPLCAVRVGSLKPSLVPEPHVEDDCVRWWRGDGGWGVIAHKDGDIWFHFTSVEPRSAFHEIQEGDRVSVELDGHGQGAFSRRASKVRRLA